MDSSTIVAAVASGAAGAFIKELMSNGPSWLMALVAGQSPKVQEQARENMANFLVRLTARVEVLEKELPADQRILFAEASSHPATALLVRDAVLKSAVTEREDTHSILAELIAKRLTADADDMIALVGSAACDVVNRLTTRQIRLLALLASFNMISDEHEGLAWLRQVFLPLVGEHLDDKYTGVDTSHLLGTGCVYVRPSPMMLPEALPMGKGRLNEDLFEEIVKEDWYRHIQNNWRQISMVSTTSTGTMIGILHRDLVTGERTTLEDWD